MTRVDGVGIRRLVAPFRDPALRSPAFLRLVANTGANGISVGADYVLVGWLTLQAGDSSAWVGGGFALYFLPGLLLGAPAGALADRLNRRSLIRNLELVGIAMLSLFAALIGAGFESIATIYCLTIALGSLRAVHHPVRLAYAYDVTGAARVVPALAGLNFSARLGFIVGAVLSGLTASAFGPGYALGAMALAHFVAWLCLWGELPQSTLGTADPTPMWANLRDYARELVRNRLLAALVLTTAGIEIFGTSFSTALPEYARERLQTGAGGLGLLHATLSSGGLVAAMVMFVLPSLRDARLLWLITIVALGFSVVGLGLTSSFVATALVLAVASAMITTWDILTQSMMQLSVPDRFRGRSMGAWMFAIGSAPLGHLQMGLVATLLGLDIALFFNGAMVLAVIVFALLFAPRLRPGLNSSH